ncbi:type IV pilin N-terminal domain-containing protein [Methanoregula sp. UBA64]|jgi:flagellin-like protein|uniref:type IV pilin N-terminal domain-containing protein n=1 Tax=Methanoregula sp. UBA64 TaxID=1915554 RepID=UPI0025DD3A9F|nr:type IV pilin N-terminal domain-containing protein [Methanoregula sp. UBA64]
MVFHTHDRAVSPVVGVMLMLAITIMIAAIASAFAGSFSDTGEKSPQSSISVPAHFEKNVTGSTDYYRIYFDHTGGDPFSLNSIQVVLRSDETENKTQLTRQGIGNNNFTLLGKTGPACDETTVRAGDRFFIAGKQTADGTGIQFGNVIFWKNKELTWMVIDSRTGKTIATGSLFPQ